MVALPGAADEVNANVSVYIGDFGTYTVHTNRFMDDSSNSRTSGACPDGWGLNPEFAKVASLRNYEMTTKGIVGDAQEGFLVWEGGLQVDNEGAHGLMADIGG